MAIAALINEIDSLEATIAAAQARIQELKSAETIGNQALEKLRAAYELISGVAPSAIDSLKEVAMSVFGVITAPSPTPTPTIDVPVAQASPIVETPVEIEKAPDSENLEAPIQIENEAQFQEKEQNAETVKVKRSAPSGKYEIVKISETVSYCLNTIDDIIQCAYAGFNNKQRAEQWGKYMLSKNVINSFEIRLSQRIEGYKYEIKMWGVSPKTLKTLSRKDLSKAPGEGLNSTSASSTETISPAISEEEARESLGFPSTSPSITTPTKEDEVEEQYYIGDWVSYQDESLEILEIYRDGTLILQSTEGTLQAHSSEVELGFRKPKNWQPFSS